MEAASHRIPPVALRATICPGGADQMRADAEFAVEAEPAWSPWHPIAVVLRGFALVLAGDDSRAEAVLADGVREASRVAGRNVWVLALSQLALYALASGDFGDAEALARGAREQAALSSLSGYVASRGTG